MNSLHRSPPSAYLDALNHRVLVYDGAMGTNIQRHHLTAEDFGGKALEGCNDHLVLTRPDVIQGIHESFLAVGCDVVETCTFQSTPRRLAEWGIGEKTRDVNVTAARLARAAADKFSTPDRPRFVAGSIGPTGMLPSSNDPALSAITFGELKRGVEALDAGRRQDELLAWLTEAVTDFGDRILPVDLKIAQTWGVLSARLER